MKNKVVYTFPFNRVYFLKFGKIKIDMFSRKYVLSFGIDLGSNRFVSKKPTNFFIEISVLFWTFGFEVLWEKQIL